MIARMQRELRERGLDGKKDDGISIIELLVAMIIVVVLSIIVVGTYQSTVASLGSANTINRNTEQASNGMNETARQIRAATSNPVVNSTVNDPAIVQANNESLVLYTYVNLQSSVTLLPAMVRFRVDPTTRRYIEETWPATQNSAGYWIFPAPTTAPISTRILSSVVAAAPATPSATTPAVFTYKVGTTTLPVSATLPFTADQLRTITSIQITLTIQTSLTATTQSVTLQNTVAMPNLNQ